MTAVTSAKTFIAHCPICNAKVQATTKLGPPVLLQALESNTDVRAVHPVDNQDHQWSLSSQDKANLLKLYRPS